MRQPLTHLLRGSQKQRLLANVVGACIVAVMLALVGILLGAPAGEITRAAVQDPTPASLRLGSWVVFSGDYHEVGAFIGAVVAIALGGLAVLLYSCASLCLRFRASRRPSNDGLLEPLMEDEFEERCLSAVFSHSSADHTADSEVEGSLSAGWTTHSCSKGEGSQQTPTGLRLPSLNERKSERLGTHDGMSTARSSHGRFSRALGHTPASFIFRRSATQKRVPSLHPSVTLRERPAQRLQLTSSRLHGDVRTALHDPPLPRPIHHCPA